MKTSKICWYNDYMRTTDDNTLVVSHFIKDYFFQHRLRFIIFLRIAQTTKHKLIKLFCDYRLYRYSRKYGLEIKSQTKIGKGFLMGHPYNITISPYAVIGDNVSINKGATIGISGGKRPGAPTIGNCVYIGINSTVIGGITIGDDVLIAPNTLLNVDVPSHSIVIGNPCKIIPRDNATAQYIYNRV